MFLCVCGKPFICEYGIIRVNIALDLDGTLLFSIGNEAKET